MLNKGRKFPDPSLLLHPQIPKPLHLLNPRTILGQEWWDTNRRLAYEEYNYHCHACGIHKSEAKFHNWLEAHEMYDINYSTGRVEFVGLVALCHSCHNYIHSGRMSMLLGSKDMPIKKYEYIMDHGKKVLKAAKRRDNRNSKIIRLREKGKLCKWEDYHLVINGTNYGQRFKSREEWEKHWKDKNKSKTEIGSLILESLE